MKLFNLKLYVIKRSVIVSAHQLVCACFSNSENASSLIMSVIWLSYFENNMTSNVTYGLFNQRNMPS